MTGWQKHVNHLEKDEKGREGKKAKVVAMTKICKNVQKIKNNTVVCSLGQSMNIQHTVTW